MVSHFVTAHLDVLLTLALALLATIILFRSDYPAKRPVRIALVLFSIALVIVNAMYTAYLNWAGPTVDRNAAIATAVCHPEEHFHFRCMAREQADGYEITLYGEPDSEQEEIMISRAKALKPVITSGPLILVFKKVERKRIPIENGTQGEVSTEVKGRENVFRVDVL